MALRAVDLIAAKRDGGEHRPEEIAWLVRGYVAEEIPDYQVSAWLMAVVWRGLTKPETFALTGAMIDSGVRLDLSGLPGVPIDKHSTGGVGDKTSLAVVPIVAAAGAVVAKMSGRGLGHTGGTLDKLESIPGCRTALSIPEIMDQARRVGACLCAQTDDLVPADRLLYALRDATGTVGSLPLIAASIMSKKLAGGARAIVLDVKVGRGAFMKTVDEARELAALMVAIGESHGRRVVALLTDMNEPLGRAVGNRVEIAEVVSLLRGDDSDRRLREIALRLSATALVLAELAPDLAAARALAEAQVMSGAALAKFREIVAAQGGDLDALLTIAGDHHGLVSAYAGDGMDASASGDASVARRPVLAPRAGYVAGIDAEAVGLAAMRAGAGRAAKNDRIDPNAGIWIHRAVGAWVDEGEQIATALAATCARADTEAAEVLAAYQFSDQRPDETPLIYDSIGP